MIDFGGTLNLTSALTVGATSNFSNVSAKGRYGTGYGGGNVATNFRQWWQTNVDVKELKDAYFRHRYNANWNWADPTDLAHIYWDNPYFVRYENYQNDSRKRIFGNVNATYKITSWLNVLGRISIDRWDQLAEERTAIGSVDIPGYSRTNTGFREINYDLLANAETNLTPDLNLRGLLGMNLRRNHFESIAAATQGGLVTPRFYALSNSRNPINAPVEREENVGVDGVFAGATVSWRNMLTLDATICRDQSTTLPQENNTYYYPSVSLGFVFSRLLPTSTWLSYGKFRANYAQVGNSAPPNSLIDVYTAVPQFGSQTQYSVSTTKLNPTLRPELTKSGEIGLEMAFLRNRIGFDFSYYDAQTFNQILPVEVSTSTGYGFFHVNAGTIRNRGVELSLNGSPVAGKNFTWNMTLNWTRNRNKVEDLYADPATGNKTENLVLGSFQGGVTLNATLGRPYGTIRGSNFIYTNGQRTVGPDGRYQISGTSNEVIGDPNPDWIAGLNNRLSYKNLSLSWLLDMRHGGDIFSLDLYYGMDTGLYPETAGNNDLGNPSRNPISKGGGVIMPGVTADGKPNTARVENTSSGTFGYEYNPAAAFVYDASFLKLREVVLTYGLPQSVIHRLAPFKGIDLSLIGRNLWIIHKNLPYSDPEEIISSGNLQGYQGGAYPTTRNIAFNLRLRF